MRLVLTRAERRHAERLIRVTAKDGANATVDLLGLFHPDAYPALIAFLAGHACEAKALPQPHDALRFSRNQPELLSAPQRREAHRRYLYGDRGPEVVAGEREYQRIKARAYRDKARGEVA